MLEKWEMYIELGGFESHCKFWEHVRYKTHDHNGRKPRAEGFEKPQLKGLAEGLTLRGKVRN